ncbi:MAG: ABC transporter ATP-binding protein [candidate division WOR-3 bacterium]|nr:ABC transporter ATP-binding protein [candidate division WOR-3 bacterium]
MIEIEDLVKKYGSIYAVRGISLEIEDGSFVGLVGPNGSGKTTLLKLIFGYCRPSYGKIKINGEDPGVRTKSFVAFFPEIDSLYPWIRARGIINWYSSFFDDWDKEKEKNLIQVLNIPTSRYVAHLSKGMRARLKLVLTLSRNAKIFLLDEPLSGIDPSSRDMIISAILKSYREDQTLILSTHIVSEAEVLFDRTIFLKDGSVMIDGESDDLREKYGKSINEIFKEKLNG